MLALTRAFAAIRAARVSPTEEQRDVLRSKVCAVVDEMKRAGETPERVVLKLRALAGAAGFDGFNDPPCA